MSRARPPLRAVLSPRSLLVLLTLCAPLAFAADAAGPPAADRAAPTAVTDEERALEPAALDAYASAHETAGALGAIAQYRAKGGPARPGGVSETTLDEWAASLDASP